MSNINQKAIVIGSINFIAFSNGYLLGQTAGMVRALKKQEDGIYLTDGQISFIASSVMMLCACGLALAALISDKIGRRWSFIIFSAPSTLNWIILYYANGMFTFVISRILAGIAIGGLFALKICSTSEYTGPNTRALFLNMISTLAPSVGTAASHALGTAFHWRTVALIGIIPSLVGIIVPYFWVESPHWLASKGMFKDCESAFRYLHGNSLATESELKLLIRVEQTKLQKAEQTNTVQTFKKITNICKKKYFWDLMLLSVFITAFLASAGKMSFTTLGITIIEGITGSANVLIFTFVVDLLVIIGGATSCILITKMSMRSLLFTTGFIGSGVLALLSACLYFKTESIYFQWVNVCLLGFYFFIVKAGPYPLLEALMGEIYPLELKIYCFFVSGTIFFSTLSLTIVLLPPMVSAMGYHGLFFLNACIMCLSLGYVWFRLPETKGRTLQEIEIYFKTNTFHKIDEVLSNEQNMKSLI